MNRADRGAGQIVEREVAVGDGVDRVGRRPVEAELGRGHRPVDREAGARQCGGTQRAFVQPSARVGKARAVAPEHLDIGQEMVTERDRLRRLQVRETRHHRGGMLPCQPEQHSLQLHQQRVGAIHRVADPQLEVRRDLVVA